MSRPEKHTVDYFQHDCIHKKTLFIVEQKYNNDGYAFWYKLLELLGSSDKHFLDLNNKSNVEFLSSKTRLEEGKVKDILNLLSRLEAIDSGLWKKNIVWCQKFVDRLSHVYTKRTNDTPHKPDQQLVEKLYTNGKAKNARKKRVTGVGN